MGGCEQLRRGVPSLSGGGPRRSPRPQAQPEVGEPGAAAQEPCLSRRPSHRVERRKPPKPEYSQEGPFTLRPSRPQTRNNQVTLWAVPRILQARPREAAAPGPPACTTRSLKGQHIGCCEARGPQRQDMLCVLTATGGEGGGRGQRCLQGWGPPRPRRRVGHRQPVLSPGRPRPALMEAAEQEPREATVSGDLSQLSQSASSVPGGGRRGLVALGTLGGEGAQGTSILADELEGAQSAASGPPPLAAAPIPPLAPVRGGAWAQPPWEPCPLQLQPHAPRSLGGCPSRSVPTTGRLVLGEPGFAAGRQEGPAGRWG